MLRGLCNRLFPSCLVPLFQNESTCKTFDLKMSLICMKMKLEVELIFIWKASHLNSFWHRGTRELGNGLLLLAFHALLVICERFHRIINSSSSYWNLSAFSFLQTTLTGNWNKKTLQIKSCPSLLAWAGWWTLNGVLTFHGENKKHKQ